MITNASDIKSSSDIYAVVSQYVDLKKRGASYVGLCPFHDEHTPSFVVTPAKGICKCFGCGKGGNAVDFIMEKLNLTYPEALMHAANVSNVSIEYDTSIDGAKFIADQRAIRKKKKEVLDTIHAAYSLYYSDLNDYDVVAIYGDRTYSTKTLALYKIAFGGETDILSNYTTLNKEHLVDIGWIKENRRKEGAYYDFFKGRILFPIMSRTGDIVGISARAPELPLKVGSAMNAKYINSPESDIYSKRDEIYGLYQAARSINDLGFAYIMEGQTDVLTAADYGIPNAVAPLGTAFTPGQAELLKRYTNEVVLAFDGDALEKTATVRAIDILLAHQMHVSIIKLPAKDDPDSFLRSQSLRGWEVMVEATKEDAIHWRVAHLDTSNTHKKEEGILTAAKLISLVDSDLSRSMYIKDVAKLMGVTSTDMKHQVNELRNLELINKKKLNASQEQTVMKYGIYTMYDKYFRQSGNGDAYEISNFIITPIMLVIANEFSLRLVSITNEDKHTVVMEIDSDDFVTLAGFKKQIARKGNFVFYGKEDDFIKVQRLIYASTPDCYPIFTMGYHKAGFLTWGNGITTPDGEFIPVNRYGIVEYDDVRYYIPAFSQIKLDMKSDEEDNEDDPGKYVIYKDGDAPDFEMWASQFYKVFGQNGIIGICYYMTSLFRDIIFPKSKTFPHLNLFGPIGSGKTFMAMRLTAMYGLVRDAVPVDLGTPVAISRRAAQVRNGLAWFDEYGLDTDSKRIQMLKMFYDGQGRPIGRKTNNNSTKTTPVNSAVIISGQVLPNQDPALLERCITLFFEPVTATTEQEKLANLLISWEDGRLSQITASLFAFRSHIKKEFTNVFARCKHHLKEISIESKPKTRVLNSFATIAAVAECLNSQVKLPFTLHEMYDYMVKRIASQVAAVKGSDEVSAWWDTIAFLIESNLLSDQYVVQDCASVKLQDEKDKSEDFTFDKTEKVLFISLTKAFNLYREYANKAGVKRLLSKNDLYYYLRIRPSYIGRCKGKDMGGKSKRCLMFYADQLPIELDYTLHRNGKSLGEQELEDMITPSIPEDPTEGMTVPEIPFDNH